jgi:hypothetical protein
MHHSFYELLATRTVSSLPLSRRPLYRGMLEVDPRITWTCQPFAAWYCSRCLLSLEGATGTLEAASWSAVLLYRCIGSGTLRCRRLEESGP